MDQDSKRFKGVDEKWKASSQSRQQHHLALDTREEGERVIGTTLDADMMQSWKLPVSRQQKNVTGQNGREMGESCGAHLHAGDASILAKRCNDPEFGEGLSAG